MGSYLSEPETEKDSTDFVNDKLICGASSMQGWRVSQEDAHNCILDYDTGTSFFAVYDGHGGQEVAQYCSEHLPQFVRNREAYKSDEIARALTDGFLDFDATITTPAVIAELKRLAGDARTNQTGGGANDDDDDAANDEEDDENVANLYKEATMPIEEVIEKYTSNLGNPTIRALKAAAKDGGGSSSSAATDKLAKSPYLKAKRQPGEAVADVTATATGTSSSSSSSSAAEVGCSKATDGATTSSVTTEVCNDTVSSSNTAAEVKQATNSNGESQRKASTECVADATSKSEAMPESTSNIDEVMKQNGVATEVSNAQNESNVSTSTIENGEISKKGKGKAKLVKISPQSTPVSTRPKRTDQQLYKNWLDLGDDSEDSDEDDATFEGPNEEESSTDEEESNAANVSIDTVADSEDDDSSDDEDDDDDDEEEEEDGEIDAETEEGLEFARNMKEEPGSDSGCTAVVALLKGNELYVANAGDSRCIVCRNGKALDMSFDHKPEDALERERIVKAGGKVTSDGRVNGGLNLSRAIGDHAYKQNRELSDREQMITALPDVKNVTINPVDDEFMVLACDGIWNYMSSQDVVDFVLQRMHDDDNMKLSQICEQMFDHCLASNTIGDGTGCDNMTAIIVKFKSNILKRSASPTSAPNERECKQVKTDGGDETSEPTPSDSSVDASV